MARSDSDNSSSDSSKKVAKAAKAGATPASSVGRDQSGGGFKLAMVGVVVLGTALVAFSWNARDVDALSPTFNDHWHLPYGFYDCTVDDFRANLADPGSPHSGIHSHGDGVVHLHPFSSSATGRNATLDVFLEATTAQLDGDDAVTFADSPALAEGVQCDGEDAVLQVARFAPGGGELIDVITEDLEDYRFLADQEGTVIALAPLGFEIPPPPAASVDAAAASSPNVFDSVNLADLDSDLNDVGIGFDEDGNLIDADGELILDPETDEPIRLDDVRTDDDADHGGDGADDGAESDDADSDDAESDDE